MFLIGVAFLAGGYLLAYWGANNIHEWQQIDNNSSLSLGTLAVPLLILAGLKAYPENGGANAGTHDVPFPYKAPANLQANPSNSGSSGGSQPSTGGAQLNPNYPGGSTGIPTPPVGGG